MVESTTGIATQVGPWVTDPGCISPPASFNIATATDAQLALYGLPPVGSMPRSIYNQKFSWMKHRDCQTRATNHANENVLSGSQPATNHVAAHAMTVRINDALWTGNVADQYPCPPNYDTGLTCPPGHPATYTEADSDYFVPTIHDPGNCYPICSSSYWVGLGGGNSNYELIQGGVEADYINDVPFIYPWIEYVGAAGSENAQEVNEPGGIHVGTHVYTRISYPNTYEIGNIDTQQFYSYSPGPAGSESTAEFIIEDVNEDGLTNFGTFTFKGMGITTLGGSYFAMSQLQHDYTVALWQGSGPQLMNIGAIVNDPNDYPYDDNSITWLESCPGSCY